ncbi:uncharacterized protein EMH_0009130 [Eimeria mitis]|uniref:Uncharacterized protein n=1 Tax=Eimeria mitis TaxID=44415 RepID=U6JTP7_9EIME|nr:uncharacterized protein EMH_0009130 [Eimeria mitis]CDJ27427.1 hypothetical protein EMH_0009130 [Eimeria mitis]
MLKYGEVAWARAGEDFSRLPSTSALKALHTTTDRLTWVPLPLPHKLGAALVIAALVILAPISCKYTAARSKMAAQEAGRRLVAPLARTANSYRCQSCRHLGARSSVAAARMEAAIRMQ